MCRSDGGAKVTPKRDGWWMKKNEADDGTITYDKQVQPIMQTEAGVQKGILKLFSKKGLVPYRAQSSTPPVAIMPDM